MFWCGVGAGSQGHFEGRGPILLDQGCGLAGAPVKSSTDLGGQCLAGSLVVKRQSLLFKLGVKGPGSEQTAAEEARIP